MSGLKLCLINRQIINYIACQVFCVLNTQQQSCGLDQLLVVNSLPYGTEEHIDVRIHKILPTLSTKSWEHVKMFLTLVCVHTHAFPGNYFVHVLL